MAEGSYDTHVGLSGLFLGRSCSGNGGLNTCHNVSLGDELRTRRKVQTSGQGLHPWPVTINSQSAEPLGH